MLPLTLLITLAPNIIKPVMEEGVMEEGVRVEEGVRMEEGREVDLQDGESTKKKHQKKLAVQFLQHLIIT